MNIKYRVLSRRVFLWDSPFRNNWCINLITECSLWHSSIICTLWNTLSAFDLRKRYRNYISKEGQNSDVKEKGRDSIWSENKSIRSNVEACFGFPLPSPETTEKADFIAEFGMCHTRRLPLEEDETRNKATPVKDSKVERRRCFLFQMSFVETPNVV